MNRFSVDVVSCTDSGTTIDWDRPRPDSPVSSSISSHQSSSLLCLCLGVQIASSFYSPMGLSLLLLFCHGCHFGSGEFALWYLMCSSVEKSDQ
jgi:hypothetical protein